MGSTPSSKSFLSNINMKASKYMAIERISIGKGRVLKKAQEFDFLFSYPQNIIRNWSKRQSYSSVFFKLKLKLWMKKNKLGEYFFCSVFEYEPHDILMALISESLIIP